MKGSGDVALLVFVKFVILGGNRRRNLYLPRWIMEQGKDDKTRRLGGC
jgi:hypothetical protein